MSCYNFQSHVGQFRPWLAHTHANYLSTTSSPVQNAVYPFMQLFYGSIAFGLIVYKTTSAFLKDHGHGGVRALMVEKCIYYAWVSMTYIPIPNRFYAISQRIVFTTFSTWALMTILSPVRTIFVISSNPTSLTNLFILHGLAWSEKCSWGVSPLFDSH